MCYINLFIKSIAKHQHVLKWHNQQTCEQGCQSEQMQTGACVSACGGLVFACGEDGAVMVWDGHTGALRALYCGLLPPGSATVHYHPYEHMLALGSLSQPPVYILSFNLWV